MSFDKKCIGQENRPLVQYRGVTQNTYDAAGNLVSNKVTKGSQSDTVTYAYSKGGQLLSMSNGTSTITYEYNKKGQQTKETVTGTTPAQKSYTYDADGNLSGVSVSNGQSVYNQGYTHNYIGQLTGVRDNLLNKDIASYTYDKAGNISTKTLANGVTTSYTYNSANALSSLTNKKGNTVLSSYAYTYYLDGNRSGVADNNGRVQSYTYDKLGQLKSETDTQNGTSRVANYTYDGSGNRITMSVSGSEQSTVEYTYDANNRLTRTSKTDNISVTEDKYYYDNNGNLITKTSSGYTDDNGEREELSLKQYPLGMTEDTDGALVISYSYTLRNMLSKVETDTGLNAEYTYDASGARAKKTVNGAATSYIWNGSDMVYEQGADTVYYSYGNGIISMTNTDGEYYHIKNGHGDVTQLTDLTGTVTEDYTYDAFGNQLTDTTADNPFRYCGEYFDSETGFIYLRNRYYDTTTGRFITEDPVKDGLNWYVYCGNNPIMFVDPLGLIPTVKAAATMADHIYGDYDMGTKGVEARTVEGWRLITVFKGRQSMKMGIYIPEGDDWRNPSEYAVVFRGTDEWFEKTEKDGQTVYSLSNEARNNVEAFFSNKSADIWDAMNFGLGFVNSVGDTEVTFVGHSKGGGEAIVAASYTDKNAITFNAANFKFYKYISGPGKGTIYNYYVGGDILSSIINMATIGIPIALPQQVFPNYKSGDNGLDITKKLISAGIENHNMSAVKSALNER